MVCATEGSQTRHPTLTNKWCFRGDGTAQFPECVQTHKYIYREMVGRHTFSWRAAQSYTPIYMCINICIHGLSAEEIASKGVRWTLGHGLPSVAADVRGVWLVYAPNHSQTPCPPQGSCPDRLHVCLQGPSDSQTWCTSIKMLYVFYRHALILKCSKTGAFLHF